MSKWTKLATEEEIKKTTKALEANGIKTVVAENGKEAKEQVIRMLPENAEVFTMTSMTLESVGLDKEIN